MDRQIRHVMLLAVRRYDVSATIHAEPGGQQQNFGPKTLWRCAGAARSLKILVSVVRFRPGPPRKSFTQCPLMQVGVFVSRV